MGNGFSSSSSSAPFSASVEFCSSEGSAGSGNGMGSTWDSRGVDSSAASEAGNVSCLLDGGGGIVADNTEAECVLYNC